MGSLQKSLFGPTAPNSPPTAVSLPAAMRLCWFVANNSNWTFKYSPSFSVGQQRQKHHFWCFSPKETQEPH